MRSLCAADKIDNNNDQFSGWIYLTLGIVALTVRRLSSNGTHTIVQLPRGEQWSSAHSYKLHLAVWYLEVQNTLSPAFDISHSHL